MIRTRIFRNFTAIKLQNGQIRGWPEVLSLRGQGAFTPTWGCMRFSLARLGATLHKARGLSCGGRGGNKGSTCLGGVRPSPRPPVRRAQLRGAGTHEAGLRRAARAASKRGPGAARSRRPHGTRPLEAPPCAARAEDSSGRDLAARPNGSAAARATRRGSLRGARQGGAGRASARRRRGRGPGGGGAAASAEPWTEAASRRRAEPRRAAPSPGAAARIAEGLGRSGCSCRGSLPAGKPARTGAVRAAGSESCGGGCCGARPVPQWKRGLGLGGAAARGFGPRRCGRRGAAPSPARG